MLRIDAAKGDKQRDIPIPSPSVTALDAWLDELATHHATTPALLGNRVMFIQNKPQPATTGWLDQLLRALSNRAGIALPDGAVAHSFRHAYGLATPNERGALTLPDGAPARELTASETTAASRVAAERGAPTPARRPTRRNSA